MKRTIVTITSDKLVLEVVDPGAKDSILMRNVFDWKSGQLGKALGVALDSTKEVGPIRILLTEDFYYVTGFKIDAKLEDDRDEIRELAEEIIPEDLERVRWDYVVLGKREKSVFVQCFALTKTFDKELLAALEKLPVKVDAIEPYSLAIMRSFKFNKSSFLLVHKDEITSLGIVVKDGLVVFSKNFDFKKFDDGINELVDFSKDFYKLKSFKLLLSGAGKSIASEFAKSLKIDEVSVSASVNLSEKTPIKGKDSKILSLQEKPAIETPASDLKSAPDLGSVSNSDSSPSETKSVDVADNLSDDKSKSRNSLYFILVLFIISIIGIGIGFFVVRII